MSGPKPRKEWLSEDYYEVLGVSADADAAAVKAAYRRLARDNHPDIHPGDTRRHERFKQVAAAYDVIGDDQARTLYDRARAGDASVFADSDGAPGAGSSGFGFGARANSSGRFTDAASGAAHAWAKARQRAHAGFGTGFGTGFGGGVGGGVGDLFGGAASPRLDGADVVTSVKLRFDQAWRGCSVTVDLPSTAACGTCGGTGGKPGTKPRICVHCEGAGFVVVVDAGHGAPQVLETCPHCGGNQLAYDEKCVRCAGSGGCGGASKVSARVPAGVRDGQQLRVRGKGAPARGPGGRPGDLLISVSVEDHPVFGRDRDDLTLTVPVTFDEAALGATVRVPVLPDEVSSPTSPGAAVRVKVPAGTQPGRVLRVRGRGARRKDGSRGDLLVTIAVTVPSAPRDLDADAQAALRGYADATPGAGEQLRARLFTPGEESAS